MRLGIFAKTFKGSTPAAVLDQVQAAGFLDAQYNMACSGLDAMPMDIPEGACAEILGSAKRLQLRIAAVSGTYNMIHPDLSVRNDGLARLEVLASRCAAMGTQLITLCTGSRDAKDQWREHPDNNSPDAWADLLVAMGRAVDIAERYDIYLGVEPELANVVNSAVKARRLIDELQSTRIQIILDPANLFEVVTLDEQRRRISEAVDLLADSIVMGHAKDRAANGAFVAAGKGVLDYTHYLKALQSIHFDGPLVTHGLAADEAVGVKQFLAIQCAQLGIAIEA